MTTVCPICNGRGTVGYFHIDHFVDIECDRCHGQGEVSADEMTNEEYLKSCTTEQLADILLHIADSCYWAGFFKGKDDNDGYDDEYCLINKNIVEWLKQPHTPKE